MIAEVPQDLAAHGFTEARYRSTPRIILSTQAHRKGGKSHFALTAPGPVAYLNFDKESEEDVMKHFQNKVIYKKGYWPESDEQEEQKRIADMFESDFKDVSSSPSVRTIVVDTESEVWEIMRMAEFGRLSNVAHLFTPLNRRYRQLLYLAHSTDKNYIFNHRLKKEYLNNEWTGGWIPSGFGEIGYVAQCNVELWRDDEPTVREDLSESYLFHCRVLDSSQTSMAKGVVLTSDPARPLDEIGSHMCTFPWLAANIFPETKYEDWL